MAPVQNAQAEAAKEASRKFLESYLLLCRWQKGLEFFLFNFCRIKAPQIVAESNWPCCEAAELNQLSERIIEYYCFHHKNYFRESGLSVKQRERFCEELHEIRKLRNAAVHREKVNSTTIKHHATSALGVLRTLRQLGGKAFEEAYGKSLDCFLLSFWDVGSEPKAILPLSDQSQAEHIPNQVRSLSTEEKKRRNIELATERQRSAERRTANNIAEASEKNQLAQHQRAVNKQLMELKQKVAVEAKAERAQKVKDQEANAKEKRMERAQKVKDQEANAERKIIERALSMTMQEEAARGAKQERARRDQALKTEAEERKRIRQHGTLLDPTPMQEIVSLLLDNGAVINAHGGPFSCAALQEAVLRGHELIVKLLLEKGANINVVGEDDGTALHTAATYNNMNIVECLLYKGADVNAIRRRLSTPLQPAISSGEGNVVKLVLDHGVDVKNQAGEMGNALQATVIASSIEIKDSN